MAQYLKHTCESLLLRLFRFSRNPNKLNHFLITSAGCIWLYIIVHTTHHPAYYNKITLYCTSPCIAHHPALHFTYPVHVSPYPAYCPWRDSLWLHFVMELEHFTFHTAFILWLLYSLYISHPSRVELVMETFNCIIDIMKAFDRIYVIICGTTLITTNWLLTSACVFSIILYLFTKKKS